MHRIIKATSSLSVRQPPQHAVRSRARWLHGTPSKDATPIPHPTITGPPPSPPESTPSAAGERITRKRQQAEALQEAQNTKINPSKPGTALQKRFWKDVLVKHNADTDSLEIWLDKRPVRTQTRHVMSIPTSKRALAGAIALEWDRLVSAQQALKQHYIPLTSLTSRALDIHSGDVQYTPTANPIRESIIKLAMKYLGTDTLLCWAPERNIHDPYDNGTGRNLRRRQRDIAEPIIAYLTTHIWPGVEIVPILGEDSIVPIAQPEMTREVIRGWVSGLPAFELAALERGVLATNSLLIAARLMVEWSSDFEHSRKDRTSREDNDLELRTQRFDIDIAAEAASIEVLHQTEQWGEVEDTHDVEREDMRRQLGSVVLLVS